MTKGNLAEGSFHCARVQLISGSVNQALTAVVQKMNVL